MTEGGNDVQTLISPRGQGAPRREIPMAPRLESLEGKTIYIVDVRWPYTHQFSEELCFALAKRYPGTTFVLREKAGAYGEDDRRLWAEIQERGNGAIMAVGH